MKENYTYGVITQKIQDDDTTYYKVTVPDFNNYHFVVENEEDLIASCQSEICLLIEDLEAEGKEAPASTNIIGKENEMVIYINLWMPYQRALIKETYTKKTLTIPTWLDLLAKSKNINFSATLVNGLKKELGITKK